MQPDLPQRVEATLRRRRLKQAQLVNSTAFSAVLSLMIELNPIRARIADLTSRREYVLRTLAALEKAQRAMSPA